MVSRSLSQTDKSKQLYYNSSLSGLTSGQVFGFNKHVHISNDPRYKSQQRTGSFVNTSSRNNTQEKSGGFFSDFFKRQKKQTHQGYRFQKDPNKKPNYRPTTPKKERTGFFSTRIFSEKFSNCVEGFISFFEYIPPPEENQSTNPRMGLSTGGGKSRGRMVDNQRGYGR
jgi:hypothetical protein